MRHPILYTSERRARTALRAPGARAHHLNDCMCSSTRLQLFTLQTSHSTCGHEPR